MLGRLVRELLLSMASTVLSRSLYIISAVVVARWWGADEAGYFGLVQAVIVMLSAVPAQAASMGAATHLSAVIRDGRRPAIRDLRMLLIFSLCVAVFPGIVFLVAPAWSSENVVRFGGQGILHAVGLTILFTVLAAVANGVLVALGRFREQTIANALAALPGALVVAFGGAMAGSFGAAWALCLAFLMQLIALSHTALRMLSSVVGSPSESGDLTTPDTSAGRNLWLVAVPVLLTGVMVAPTGWIASRILHEMGGGISQVGLYAAGSQILAVFSQLSVVLAVVLVPRLTRSSGLGEDQIDAVNMLAGWIAVLVCALPLLLWPEVIGRVFGGQYVSQRFNYVVQFLSIAAILMAFKGGIGRKVVAKGYSWFSVVSNAGWLIGFVILASLMAPYGAAGVAFAFFVAHLGHFVVGLPFFARMGLMHWRYLVSPGAIGVWCSVILVAGVGLSGHGLVVRTGALLLGIVSIAFGTRYLLRANKEVK
ncbi:hypothetical protein D7T39_07955 [Stenotrophomonas maltophilia]|nr:hypothetical protein [Stenotrophomonas maltophilia]MBA0484799.1 hypothetical protein [Stenotrophomonas maltophilia]